jgi:hypothetical protein
MTATTSTLSTQLPLPLPVTEDLAAARRLFGEAARLNCPEGAA